MNDSRASIAQGTGACPGGAAPGLGARPRCLFLSGARGTGKSTLGHRIAQDLSHYLHVSVSACYRASLIVRGLEPTADAMRALGENLVGAPERMVEDVLAFHSVRPGKTGVVWDALRQLAVRPIVERLTNLPGAHAHLVLPEFQRLQRLKRRGDVAAVLAGSGHITESEVNGDLLRAADLLLDARDPVDDLSVQVRLTLLG